MVDVTVFSIVYAIGTPIITAFTLGWDRRKLLLKEDSQCDRNRHLDFTASYDWKMVFGGIAACFDSFAIKVYHLDLFELIRFTIRRKNKPHLLSSFIHNSHGDK